MFLHKTLKNLFTIKGHAVLEKQILIILIIYNKWKLLLRTGIYISRYKVFIPIPKKGNAKDCSNYCTIALISHPSKVMLKILQARLQQYMNRELPDVQAGFRKGRGTRDQIASIR